ncbi:hypothetical protein LOZ51_005999 [Ophidiomyces ophidiicola]|nr:hypothetical protein LOZ55_004429 [Ophidiomyces ophidiicola]KAI1986407.1 hypothetical protein LOZ51_005999 [Ophidiomyces ophidiicola]KAI1990141.1 hypothetical protein LOZ54_002635 [Ophidiomyces ophidiicola]
MALVTYSDSEASDSETTPPNPPTASRSPPTLCAPKTTAFQPLVDRSNPRKIIVTLADTKSAEVESNDTSQGGEPARKRARIGGSGTLTGFNAMLPAPKRAALIKPSEKSTTATVTRKVFDLKTSSSPGFSREPQPSPSEDYGTTTEEGLRMDGDPANPQKAKAESQVVEKKGNSMMFKPLSVARNSKKRPKPRPVAGATDKTAAPSSESASEVEPQKPKQKLNLFGLSSDAILTNTDEPYRQTHYEPMVHVPSRDSELQSSVASGVVENQSEISFTPSQTDSLANVASDLKLSRSEMRQLMGRKGRASAADTRILTFNTDQEYKSNSALLSAMSEQELAAQQHNPVRSIAPGKHSLQQLVNAVGSQRDALEDSFMAGKRNRKEAGSRYGW